MPPGQRQLWRRFSKRSKHYAVGIIRVTETLVVVVEVGFTIPSSAVWVAREGSLGIVAGRAKALQMLKNAKTWKMYAKTLKCCIFRLKSSSGKFCIEEEGAMLSWINLRMAWPESMLACSYTIRAAITADPFSNNLSSETRPSRTTGQSIPRPQR